MISVHLMAYTTSLNMMSVHMAWPCVMIGSKFTYKIFSYI